MGNSPNDFDYLYFKFARNAHWIPIPVDELDLDGDGLMEVGTFQGSGSTADVHLHGHADNLEDQNLPPCVELGEGMPGTADQEDTQSCPDLVESRLVCVECGAVMDQQGAESGHVASCSGEHEAIHVRVDENGRIDYPAMTNPARFIQ
jgi:hypothetical protein